MGHSAHLLMLKPSYGELHHDLDNRYGGIIASTTHQET